MSQEVHSRRKFLLATTTATAGGLAGCTNLPDRNENSTETTEYKIEIEPENTETDLTDLKNWEHTEDTVRDQDYIKLGINLYENQEKVEPDNIRIIGSNGQLEHDTEDSLQKIACTQLEPGTNTLTIETEKNSDTTTEQIDVTKKLPTSYLIEAYVDNQKITEHETPYSFDNHNLETDWFERKRQQAVRDRAREEVVENFNPKEIEEIDTTTKEGKNQLIDMVGRHVRAEIGRHSGHAQVQAATEEQIIHNYTDFEPDQVHANGFNNPHDDTADTGGTNHGSKAIHLDSDWYHHETIGSEVAHIEDIERIDMVDGISNPDYVSILGEFERGEMEEVKYFIKTRRQDVFFLSQVVPASGPSTRDVTISDNYGSIGLEMIRDNGERDEIFNPVKVAGDHYNETGRHVGVFGTPRQPTLLADWNNGRDTFSEVRENPDFEGLEQLLE
ncbi:hypothetical protein [Natranaeroarchaeum aerophilus]|uniref:Uncharacterized protein n=1 Tax=Natranaeroarchaeum aerophilus TaxID=2917711 RepID=A0AAE3K3V8_9EURY|nr:hypothetical protein [Natranaeroarchaeum aerophilus]MCL9812758.1 hypothetical protein [Natranaeroarchaeum aerophilus]